ncbi:hypothetical protein GGR52DRAFT_311221 [Hypoxylon sp. FL1284]|nr:hypothetical protein GGR52DRAFT_311221 [Hypoxylon sp. FL1284]
MPIKQKLAAFAVFGVGSLAWAIGCVGIYLRAGQLGETDFTWICTQAALLVISEICIVIVVGCLPTLPRLYHYLRRRSHSGTTPSEKGSPNNNSRDPPSSGQSDGSSDWRSRERRQNTLSGSLAKYMRPGFDLGITTLATRASGEERRSELRGRANDVGEANNINKDLDRADVIWKTMVVEQRSSMC